MIRRLTPFRCQRDGWDGVQGRSSSNQVHTWTGSLLAPKQRICARFPAGECVQAISLHSQALIEKPDWGIIYRLRPLFEQTYALAPKSVMYEDERFTECE